jgi:ATP-binding cassette, subfamily F, member 3
MAANEVILRFDNVTFEFGETKTILSEADFILREGAKVTIMGQNGAGKSTILGLILKHYEPKEGRIIRNQNLSIGHARQTIAQEERELTLREYFARAFEEKKYNLDQLVKNVFEVVNLQITDYDRLVKQLSGGQQARLLLAFALIQNPDILLLDEPTNNLDQEGIDHLMMYLIMYEKTVVVISHDADFLNSFTDTVWYLDVHKHQVEMYDGNYYDVTEQIAKRIERENQQNARMQKEIEEKKDKINFFANKGGKMRRLAAKLREDVEEAEGNKVEVRREDRTIRPFTIPCQDELSGDLMSVEKVQLMQHGDPVQAKIDLRLYKGKHIQLKGPNGIGKTTLLEALATNKIDGLHIAENLEIGYYRQDFSTLDFDKTVRESLVIHSVDGNEEYIRKVAAGFLVTAQVINTRIGDLSEGQKGLVAFTHLVLQKPGLLILDEPTNHINFRHLPIIAKALDEYEGAMILVSHMPDFVSQIKIEEVVDLEKLIEKNS